VDEAADPYEGADEEPIQHEDADEDSTDTEEDDPDEGDEQPDSTYHTLYRLVLPFIGLSYLLSVYVTFYICFNIFSFVFMLF
jgi:hypothetical protein